MTERDQLLADFIIETKENLAQMEQDLLEIERDFRTSSIESSDHREKVGRIFRILHTIKGTCSFLSFPALEELVHDAEHLLGKLRDDSVCLTPSIIATLIELEDLLVQAISYIEANRSEMDDDFLGLRSTLVNLAMVHAFDANLQDKPAMKSVATPANNSVETPIVASALNSMHDAIQTAGINIPEASTSKTVIETASSPLTEERLVTDQEPSSPPPVVESMTTNRTSSAAQPASTTDKGIRVDVELLDKLMNLVGELVLTRNQISQRVQLRKEGGAFDATAQRLDIITSELQEQVMKTRMQPLSNIWGKFPRLVRDLSMASGKQVRLETSGADTELDRTLIEAVKGPLLTLLKNIMLFGIETPQSRLENGKTPEALISWTATHEGGQVTVQVRDDGLGVNFAKLRDTIGDSELIRRDDLRKMMDQDLLDLLFSRQLANYQSALTDDNSAVGWMGLSTVRAGLEKVGGSIDLASSSGEGCTFRIKIPLTLAILPALVVRCQGLRYAIPQTCLQELVREDASAIDYLQDAPVWRLRGRILPIVPLDRVLGLDTSPASNSAQRTELEKRRASGDKSAVNIVVLHGDGTRYGLLVDEVLDTEEVVVKPLRKNLKTSGMFSGATILGDGAVALILDVVGLGKGASVTSTGHSKESTISNAVIRELQERSQDDEKPMLIVSLADGERLAMPLGEVFRLEEFAPSEIERTGTHNVVQYRNDIMPLVNAEDILNGCISHSSNEYSGKSSLSVVVLRHDQGHVGVIVERIEDVVEEAWVIKAQDSRQCMTGTTVLQGKVTGVINVSAVKHEANLGR